MERAHVVGHLLSVLLFCDYSTENYNGPFSPTAKVYFACRQYPYGYSRIGGGGGGGGCGTWWWWWHMMVGVGVWYVVVVEVAHGCGGSSGCGTW